MRIAVCIFAKNEAKNIVSALSDLARQKLLSNKSHEVTVHVVANGCTDETVDCAKLAEPLFDQSNTQLKVHDLYPGGKSRAWNRAIHELVDPATAVVFCMDADIRFIDDSSIANMISQLDDDVSAAAIAGYPVKDIAMHSRGSLLKRFSSQVSRQTRHVDAISGQLYAVRAVSLTDIWLPDETPGEDGFLNAMLTTRGFTRGPDVNLVRASSRPTHLFKAVGPRQFLAHERRLIVGTVINRWIFEHLWSLRLTTSAGPLIQEWNARDPDWVEKLIRRNSAGRRWLIPNSITFGRMKSRGATSWSEALVHVSAGVAATLATLLPAFFANRVLKQAGSASTW